MTIDIHLFIYITDFYLTAIARKNRMELLQTITITAIEIIP
jgi:hypothetical protein